MAVGLLLAALLACCGAQGGGATGRRYFGLRIQSRDEQQPTFRRSLLRNTTMPLHGAVKDFGCVRRSCARL